MEQIRAVLANQFFTCAGISGAGCPEGLARLLIIDRKDPDRSGVCSGFLVSADTLVTNQHCVPSGAVCDQTYVAVYAGGGYQEARCLSLTQTLNDFDDPNDPRKVLDVAIMKITPVFTGRNFVPAVADALPGDPVTAWVIDHTGLDRSSPNLLESRVTEFRCRVAPSGGWSAMIVDECPIIKGNSGSPLVDDRGEVVGIVWGGSAHTVRSDLSLFARRRLEAIGAATPISRFRQYLRGPLRSDSFRVEDFED
jgi:hypothetical protein